MPSKPVDDAIFHVPGDAYHLGRFAERHAQGLIRLGGVETRYLEDALAPIRIERPVYVCGLARSGTTILLELLAALPGVATHRYRDYPFLHVPYFWNRWLDMVPRRQPAPVERTHLDGILVTPESPEAMEEVLWMAFFPHAHDPSGTAVLDAAASHPAFETFYRDHLRKLLLVRRGRRYASKGNYLITRMEYLLKMFPDARFVVPVREPSRHIASLRKQHALFCRGETVNPRMIEHLRRVGHFEFGLDRRAIQTGTDAAREVAALWAAGDELRGWARYWNAIHEFLLDRLEDSPALRAACLLVRYEDLCAEPESWIRRILRHGELPGDEAVIRAFAGRIAAPAYYRVEYRPEDLAVVREETRPAAARLGYEPASRGNGR